MQINLVELASRFQHSIEAIAPDGQQPSATSMDNQAWDELMHWLTDLGDALSEDTTQDELVIGPLTDAASALRRISMGDDSAVLCLGRLLDMLAGILRRSGHDEAARIFGEEHVAIRKSLATASSEPWHQVTLARALAELSRTLSVAERNHEALAAAQEAVAHIRKAGEAGYPVLQPLADHLTTLQFRFSDVDRCEEALAAAQEAVSAEAQLRLADPTGDPTRLADALRNLALRLSDLERFAAAFGAAREAASLLRQLAAEGAPDARNDLADILDSLARYARRADQQSDAVAAAREAATVYRQLAAEGSTEARYNLADILFNLTYSAERAGQWSDAVAAAREEIAVRQQLPARKGTRDESELAYALQNLAHLLWEKAQYDEVAQLAGEAVVRYRQMAAEGLLDTDDLFWFEAAVDLVRDRLVAGRQYKVALEAAREQVALLRHLADKHPDRRKGLAYGLDKLADVLAAVRKHSEAAAARAEASAIRYAVGN